MNFTNIQTFLEIAATGSFHQAAERLHVTQSTVSIRIKALEQELDRELFTRSRNGVELTGAGRQFQRHALTLMRTWEQVRRELTLPEGFSASFGLGTQISLWERLIARWAPWMRKQIPDVALRLEADYSASLMQLLASGYLDMGVMYAPRKTAGLIIQELFAERLILVSTSPQETADSWRRHYVFVHWGPQFVAAHEEAFPDLGVPPVSVGLGAMGLNYVLENGGAGYFPLRVVRTLLAEGRLFRIAGAPTIRRPVYMVYPANPANDSLLRLAMDGLMSITALECEDDDPAREVC